MDLVRHEKKHLPEKACAHCGCPFAWRKKWATVLASVKYRSAACRVGPGAEPGPHYGDKNR